MKRQTKNFLSGLLAVITLISMSTSALAMDRRPASQTEENGVVFSHVSQLTAGGSMRRTLTGTDGAEIVVGIKKLPAVTRSGGETWQVWYKAIGVDVEFYMTVSNNRVTSVYDYSITLIGASYDNPSLTKTSTYGKLTYTYKAIAALPRGPAGSRARSPERMTRSKSPGRCSAINLSQGQYIEKEGETSP